MSMYLQGQQSKLHGLVVLSRGMAGDGVKRSLTGCLNIYASREFPSRPPDVIERNVEHDAWDLAGLKKLPITGKRTTY